jgi:hypothetical protein
MLKAYQGKPKISQGRYYTNPSNTPDNTFKIFTIFQLYLTQTLFANIFSENMGSGFGYLDLSFELQ